MSRPATDVTDSAVASPGIAPRPIRTTVERRRFDRSIVDGPLLPTVWKLAWPTMLTNIIGGMQGIIDHAMGANYNWIRDQIYLPKGEQNQADVLLRRRALQTGFEYELFGGLSYTFGSIFNNVVNPRFEGANFF